VFVFIRDWNIDFLQLYIGCLASIANSSCMQTTPVVISATSSLATLALQDDSRQRDPIP